MTELEVLIEINDKLAYVIQLSEEVSIPLAVELFNALAVLGIIACSVLIAKLILKGST